MDSGAMITGAPDSGSCDGTYLDTVFSSYCEPTLGNGPNCDDTLFPCCTSEWDYSSTVESCISVHATMTCDDYGYGPTADGRSSAVADCSSYAGLLGGDSTITAADTTPTATSPATTSSPSAKSPLTPYASSATGKSASSIVVDSSKTSGSSNKTLASSSAVGKSTGSASSPSVVAGTTTNIKSTGSGTASGTSASASSTKSTSAASGVEIRTSAAVGLFAMLAVVLFRAGL